MSGKITTIEEMSLANTKEGKITVTTIEEPYGTGSESIASIGIALQANSDEPDWKVHLPKENIEGVKLGRQKGQIVKSKLDGREEEIMEYMRKEIPVTTIAKICDVGRTTMGNFIRGRKLREKMLEETG
jgi:hypothetical protein